MYWLAITPGLKGQIINGRSDITRRGDRAAGRCSGLAIGALARIPAPSLGAAPATQQLDAYYAQGQRYPGRAVTLGIGPHFGISFHIHLGAFLQIWSNAGAVRPVGAFHPDRFIFLVSLCIPEFLGMCYVEIDYTLAIHGVGDTILPQVTNDL